ncbi:MAG TPA: hypothetical protein VL738_24835 [Dactylosporangium sp.]|jgi:hypothetical protein|nr:hypothetical protein [Dactylosporangium sp.]
MSENRWLVDGCARLLAAPAAEARRRDAAGLGARAADAGLPLRDVIAGMLRGASAYWQHAAAESLDSAATVATLHARAAVTLEAVETLVAAAVDGYTRAARSELARHDGERTAFVSDLLAGRVEPGVLAERANRYGIRLSATHVVLVARGQDFTTDLARRVDSALAARFGEGNTLTSTTSPTWPR